MAEPTNPQAPSQGAQVLTDSLERPALDNRSYRVIQLKNKLEALIIHDPDTDKVSAALDVNVGSFSDAQDMPGMAHAVEHLLFMGTEKYPKENAYNQYLSSHSGYSNAYTAATSTNYFFECSAHSTPSNSQASSASTTQTDVSSKTASPLYGALDRFAQFFVAPLFLEDTLDRELRAVDSENKKNLQSDQWRLHQLNKTLSNPDHPFCQFSTGNYTTLHDDPLKRGVKIRDEFIRFYEKQYSANRMKLVVLGRESLSELESWVEELFSDVKNKDLPQNRWDNVSPYTEKELGMQIFAKPVYDTRSLDFYFPYQDEEELFESQPGRYLSHLIGHEGPGSILAYIKAKGWANGLGAGAMPTCPGSALFSITIRLTEDGLKHYMEVASTVFQYIAMIKEKPPQEWVVDELIGMSEVDFRFKQKSPASRTTSSLSSVMQRPLPREWLLSGPSVIRKFNPEAIEKALSYLRPGNCRLTVISQEFPGDWDSKEKWYGTEYKYEPIPNDLRQLLAKAAASTPSDRPAELHLPHRNEFIPTRLDVEKKDVDTPLVAPKLIRNEENVRSWFKKDDRFWVPKANFFVTLRTPLAHLTPQSTVLTSLYKELIQDDLSEYSYDAEISGLQYLILSHSVGLDVSIHGYNDKMSVLLEKVLHSMRYLKIRNDRFKIIKERLQRGFRNWDFQQPYHQVGTFSRWLTSSNGWINDQYASELAQVTADDVRAFIPQLLRQLHIECLAHGNLHREDVLKMTDLVQKTLQPRVLPPEQWPTRRHLILPESANYVYERTLKDPANVNHCIEYMIAVGNNQDRELRAKLLLVSQMTDEPAFDQLRTKEQLGYVVWSGAAVHNTWAGYRVLIQSEKNPAFLDRRIDAFLLRFEKTLETMSEQEFEDHKRSLINKRLEKMKNLTQESNRFWTHIVSDCYDFEQVDADVSHISSLTKNSVESFFATHISPRSSTRRTLSVHLLAQSSPADLSTSEQKEALKPLLKQLLTSNDIAVDESALSKRLESVNMTASDLEDKLGSSVYAYLVEDVQTDTEVAGKIVARGKEAMADILPTLGIKTSLETEARSEIQPNGTGNANTAEEEIEKALQNLPDRPLTKIANVAKWKAHLELSRGAAPVRELSEFEDRGARL